jgi:predicted nucleotidyltransferase
MISNETLLKVKERLVDGFHPEKIILFGSQARDTADDRSDVDLLVICRFKGKRRELMVEIDDELREIEYAFDIVVLTPDEFQRDSQIPGTIGRYATQEGKTIYEQSKS